MVDNVIILGAGASFDAGIPLLRDFAETIMNFSLRGERNVPPLEDSDREVFLRALQVRDELDGYHGRAAFDDRNIEDILSILTFNTFLNSRASREGLKRINSAISRTIELTCNVKHDGSNNKIISAGNRIYRDFWQVIFQWIDRNNPPPTIISFNYDLVLERSLFQLMINNEYSETIPPFAAKSMTLRYYYDLIDHFNYRIRYLDYHNQVGDRMPGSMLEPFDGPVPDDSMHIELLKLHGSLNFPKTKRDYLNGRSPVLAIADPFILPPVFNKTITRYGQKIWAVALERLRGAKNVIFVGYSLPQTDTYMQFFIKSALGPNRNLNRVFVFDPAFANPMNRPDNIRERYEGCFSEQMRRRISFNGVGFENFVSILKYQPGSVLF